MANADQPEQKEVSYGEINYKAYYDDRGGITYDNKPIPTWDKLGLGIQSAWEIGAQSVIQAFIASEERKNG